MQEMSKGYFLNTMLVDEIDEEKAEILRKHGLDKESQKRAKAVAKSKRKKWFGIF